MTNLQSAWIWHKDDGPSRVEFPTGTSPLKYARPGSRTITAPPSTGGPFIFNSGTMSWMNQPVNVVYPDLDDTQWNYLLDTDNGEMRSVVDAAKAALPAGKLRDMFVAVVDRHRPVQIKTVLTLTDSVRPILSAAGKVTPTEAEIREKWLEASTVSPALLLQMMSGS